MPTNGGSEYRQADTRCLKAWGDYLRGKGLTSRCRIEDIARQKERRGKWPRKGHA